MTSAGIPVWKQRGTRSEKRPANVRKEERPVPLTQQLAEVVVSLLGLGFPSSSEGHRGDAGGARVEMLRQAEEQQGGAPAALPCLYTPALPHLHSPRREGNYSRGR